MNIRSIVPLLGLGVFITLVAARAQEKIIRQASLTSEKMIFVNVEGGLGSFVLRKSSDPSTVYSLVQNENDDDDAIATVTYVVKNNKGMLRIELNTDPEEGGLSEIMHLLKGRHGGRWRLELTDKVPMDIRLEYGAGEADLDFSGLNVAGLRLETGASSLRMRSSSPNPGRIGTVAITAGLGSIESESLGNLNFERLRFEGGLGSYQLDLTGALRDGAQIRAEVGMGSLDIVLPAHTGVVAHCEDSFLSSSNFHRFVRVDDDVYQTPNYRNAVRRVKMNLESGIGSVSVRRED